VVARIQRLSKVMSTAVMGLPRPGTVFLACSSRSRAGSYVSCSRRRSKYKWHSMLGP
jgi:hypothetical protein